MIKATTHSVYECSNQDEYDQLKAKFEAMVDEKTTAVYEDENLKITADYFNETINIDEI